jgi:hypothetical protein
MASILLSSRLAHLFLPPIARENCVRRHRLEMKKLVRELLVLAMLAVVSVGAFAQKQGQGQDKRPDKVPVKVIDRKDNRPPPQNSKQPKRDDKKRP